MAKDPNFVSVRLPDDVAIWLREYATTNKMVRADKPNMGGSIIAIVRSVMQGQTMSNNIRQSSAAPDVDIQAMIDDALNSKIKELREEFEEHERIYQAQCQRGFELQIATFREEMNEAIATAKKPLLSLSNERESISNLEADELPIIEAIANIAAPSIEKSLDSNVLSNEIAATDNPKTTKRSAKSKAILSRPEALAIAQKFGFNGTGQNLYDWAKAALNAKSEESKLSNREKLAAVGLVAAFTPENKPAWKAKTR